MVDGWIKEDPESSYAYFDRHFAWLHLSEPRRALEDISKAIELKPQPIAFKCRADVYRHIGEYEKAIEDYGRGEAIDPEQWTTDAFPLIYQADTYARLGDEPMALAYCARLPDAFWTPGHDELLPGVKSKSRKN
jgi:tetratricopeptide (TPR) repeat protein